MEITRLPHGDGLTFALTAEELDAPEYQDLIAAIKYEGVAGKYRGSGGMWFVAEADVKRFYELYNRFCAVVQKDQQTLF